MPEAELPLSELIENGAVLLGRGDIISTDEMAAFPGDYPVYSSSARGTGEFGRYGKYMFDEELITWSVDGGGRPFYRSKHRFSVTNVCGYLRIKDKSKWDYRFIHAAMELQHARITFDYQMKAHPSVIKKLYAFNSWPLEKQQRIAEILSTVDEAIEQTEALIAKTQQIKAGLMHDLFTRGVTPDGQLRPPREEAPQLYKESPLGWIPKDWGTTTIGEMIAKVVGGAAIKNDEFFLAGMPVIAKGDVTSERHIDAQKIDKFVAVNTAVSRYRRSLITNKYIVVSLRDLVPTAPTVGLASFLSGEGEFLLAQGAYGLVCKDEVLQPEIFVEYTRYSAFRRLMRILAVGSTQVHVRSTEYLEIVLPKPGSDEQFGISSRIVSAIEKERTIIEGLTKLKLFKMGLMSDLLSGAVEISS